jgi:flagellar biosynthesis/type III secretory pathway chaperone
MSALPKPVPTPPVEPGRLVAELIVVTDRLCVLMAAETALLKSPGLPKLDAIVPEKLKLSARYDSLMQVARMQPPGQLKNEADAPRLAATLARLQSLAQDNAKTVDVHIKANRRVLDLVARAARRATTTTFTYGKQRMGYGIRSERHPSVSVNRVL